MFPTSAAPEDTDLVAAAPTVGLLSAVPSAAVTFNTLSAVIETVPDLSVPIFVTASVMNAAKGVKSTDSIT